MDRRHRVEYYEGLRGIASVQVVFCHLVVAFAPAFYFYSEESGTIAKVWIESPLNVLCNGNVAVQFFFLMTGYFACRKGYLAFRNTPVNGGLTKEVFKKLTKEVFKKYYRLLFITCPAVFLSFILMKNGLMYHIKAFELNPDLSYLNSYNNFEPNFIRASLDAFVKVFIKSSAYVGPLWTIRIEFVGYAATLLAAIFIQKIVSNIKTRKYCWILLSIIAAVLFDTYLGTVFWGALIYQLDGEEIEDCVRIKIGKVAILILWIVGVYFMCCNYSFTGIWAPLQPLNINSVTIRGIGCALVFYNFRKNHIICRALSQDYLVFLGKLSAYTYAFHWPIILSVGSYIYVHLWNKSNAITASIIVFTACIVLSLIIAWGGTKIKDYVCDRFIPKMLL